jgi:hypothetical protein
VWPQRQCAGTSYRHQCHRCRSCGSADSVPMPRNGVVSGPVIIQPNRQKTRPKGSFEGCRDRGERMASTESARSNGADEAGDIYDSVIHRAFHRAPWHLIAQFLKHAIAAFDPSGLEQHRRLVIDRLERVCERSAPKFGPSEKRCLHAHL